MKKNNFFWVSYSDLMTSLFFIVLLLFSLMWSLNKDLSEDSEAVKEKLGTALKDYEAVKKELGTVLVKNKEAEKIKEIKKAIETLPKDYFVFDSDNQRFQLRKNISFEINSSEINTNDYEYLSQVGNQLVNLIKRLDNEPGIRYLVLIEGMASKDSYSRNYELSYERALSLYRFWETSGISFDPNRCEVHISGSGTGGIGRFPESEERKNQRFLIQIIPKVGNI
ncbi:MAG: OmpA family protein [Bacteroidales bacterium]